MYKLDFAIALITTSFPDEWWVSLGFDKTREERTDISENITSFIQKLNTVEEEFFDLINISILRGEYIEDVDFKDKLNTLKNLVDSLSPSFVVPDEEVQEILFVTTYSSGFREPLKLAINFYSEFFINIERKIKISEKKYIIKYHDEIIDSLDENKCDADSKNNLNLIFNNLKVAEYDHFLSSEKNVLEGLFTTSRKLSTVLNIKPYSALIRLKADFLRDKILLRLKHESKPKQIYTLINGIEKAVSATDMVKPDNIFNKWLNYLDSHYELKADWKEDISTSYETLKNKPLDSCDTMELHRLIKYHKDVNRSLPSSVTLIKQIRAEIEKRRAKKKTDNNIFDLYALSIDLNYAINNEFSLTCEYDNSTKEAKENAEKLYNEIIQIQSQSAIKNFFPQTRFLKLLLSRLKLLYKEKKAIGVISECREIIDFCQKELYEKYEENVNWTKENYNYVFQLPFSECCITIDDANTDRLFVFSSFLMPLPKGKYLKEFSENRNEVSQLEASVKVFENVKHEFGELYSFKDKEFRLMEILGIFTAVISFIAASLPTFRFIETPLEAALFMLALSNSFAVFVFLLFVSFRGIDKLKKHKNYIIIGFITAIVLWGTLITLSFFNPFKTMNQPKVDKEKNDSSGNLSTVNLVDTNITISETIIVNHADTNDLKKTDSTLHKKVPK